MKPSCIILFASVVCLFFTNPSFGQTRASEKEQRDKAEQYFARGEVLFEEGDYTKAAEAFLLAYETVPHPAVLINAGLSFERAKNLPQALNVYQKYIKALREQGAEDEEVEKKIGELNSKVGKIAISADCGDDTCTVIVDDLQRGASPVAVTVMPGTHKIEAMKGDELEAIKYVVVVAGEVQAVQLKAMLETEPEPEQEGPKLIVKITQKEFKTTEPIFLGTGSSKLKLGIPFWISGGVAVAGIVTGAGIWLSTYKDEKDFKATDDTDERKAIQDKVRKKYIVEGIAFGVGGAAAIAATIFVILDNKSSKNKNPDQISVRPGPGLGVEVSY